MEGREGIEGREGREGEKVVGRAEGRKDGGELRI